MDWKDKRLWIGIFLVAALFIFYFSLFGIQTVSTDKDVYSLDEKIEISWFSFKIDLLTCSDNDILVFKENPTGWERVPYKLYGHGGYVCVEGKASMAPMHCDMVETKLPELKFDSGEKSWNLEFYKRNGTVGYCQKDGGEFINYTIDNYELKKVEPGEYRIKFGIADKAVRIKG